MIKYPSYSTYRPSGIDWLGDLPDHWKPHRLKFDLSRNDGGVWGEDVAEGESGTIVLRSTEVNLNGTWNLDNPARRKISSDEYRKAVLLEGDLLITKSSGSEQHLGKVAVVTIEIAQQGCAFSNFMQRLRVTRYNDPKFMFYLLNCDVGKDQLGFLGSTTTGLRNLSAVVISEVILPGTPLHEQRTIVAFLDRETENIETLIAKKRTLIYLLGKQRSSIISNAVIKGLFPNTPMKSSGIEWLGDVPEHCNPRRLKFDLSRNDGGVWGEDVDIADDSAVTVLRSTEINLNGTWNLSNPAKRKLSATELQKKLLKNGDLLITKSSGSEQHLGKTAIVTKEIEQTGCAFSNFMQRLRVSRQNSPKFLFYLLNCDVGKEQLGYWGSTTTGLRNLTATVFGEIFMPGIPKPEQEQIVAFLDNETQQIDNLVTQVEESIRTLEKQRSALISAVVTGRIDVRTQGQA